MPVDPHLPPQSSPWHAGERAMQASVGISERMEKIGHKIMRDYMSDQHRAFYAQLPYLLLGAVDSDGAPWATVLTGPAGFAQSPDPRTLRVNAALGAADPAQPCIVAPAAVGFLGICLATRRRNRLNGTVAEVDMTGFSVTVDQAFGNCPKYIQTRDLEFSHGEPSIDPGRLERLDHLDDNATSTIGAADTFFVASYVDVEGNPTRRQVDMSHRGD